MISKRLLDVAKYIKSEDLIADIGCDHALLDIYLIKEKNLKKIIVSDVNQNALNNAILNIKNNNLEDKITAVLSDGIKNININKINTLVISGMGSINIIKILKDIKKYKSINKIVIQSNNDHYYLRKFMVNNGYYINSESLVKDKGLNYITIEFIRGYKLYFDMQYTYGPHIMNNKDYLWYFEELLKSYNILVNLVPKNKHKVIDKKIKKVMLIIKKLKN